MLVSSLSFVRFPVLELNSEKRAAEAYNSSMECIDYLFKFKSTPRNRTVLFAMMISNRLSVIAVLISILDHVDPNWLRCG